jgi:hypothetical protein
MTSYVTVYKAMSHVTPPSMRELSPPPSYISCLKWTEVTFRTALVYALFKTNGINYTSTIIEDSLISYMNYYNHYVEKIVGNYECGSQVDKSIVSQWGRFWGKDWNTEWAHFTFSYISKPPT